MKEYVAATHKLSLSLLAIVFLAWQISQIHANRVRMLNEAKELLTIEVFLKQIANPAPADKAAIPRLPPCGSGTDGQDCMATTRQTAQRRESNVLAEADCPPNPNPANRVYFLVSGFPDGFELAFLPRDRQLSQVLIPTYPSPCNRWTVLRPIAEREESFGRLALYSLTMSCIAPMRCRTATAYLAIGHDPAYGDWFTGLFDPSDPTIKPQTNRLIRELGIDSRLEGAARIEAIQSKLFSQKIKIPFLEEVMVRTELAVWVLAFGAFFVLVSMRNQLRLALVHPLPQHDLPWILLDAETFVEKAIAAGWWFLLIISGAVTTFAVLLSATDSNQAALATPAIWTSLATFAAAIGLGAGNLWASFECAGYLLMLRRLRQLHLHPVPVPDPAWADEESAAY